MAKVDFKEAPLEISKLIIKSSKNRQQWTQTFFTRNYEAKWEVRMNGLLNESG